MGLTASTVALRISEVASPVRKICTSCPASAKASAWAKTNDPRVGSSVPHPPLIMIFSFFEGVWAGAWASLVEAAKAPTASNPAAN